MEKLEMRFSQSVILAVECMLRILSRTFSFIPKGTVLAQGGSSLDKAQQRAEAPVWCNFAFFSKIKATPIWTRKCDERWRLERRVLFFHHDAIVAVVTLNGMQIGNHSEGWAVSKIRYALVCDRARSKSAERWVELELEVLGYDVTSIADAT